MENETNYLIELDKDGQKQINPIYYHNVINDAILDYMDKYGIDRNKITGNDLLSVFSRLKQSLFTANHTQPYNRKCNIPYTQYNISSLLQVYIDICLLYKVHPSIYGFSMLTNISEDAIQGNVTLAQSEILNIRREMLRNDLASDRMGRIVLANNDSSYGLEYEKKNTIERETVRQGLALNDLPKLE